MAAYKRKVDSKKSEQGEQPPEQPKPVNKDKVDAKTIEQGKRPPEQPKHRNNGELAVRINVDGNQPHARSIGHSWKEKLFDTTRRKVTMTTLSFPSDK